MDQDVPRLLTAVESVVEEMAKVPSVKKVAIIGSLAKTAKKIQERDRLFGGTLPVNAEDDLREDTNPSDHNHVMLFSDSKRSRSKQMHDVDLAVWVSGLKDLRSIRHALAMGVKNFIANGNFGVSNNEFDVFLLDATSSKYLGNLCSYARCPKGKEDCQTPACGEVRFLKLYRGFTFYPDSVNSADRIDVYDAPEALSIQPQFDIAAVLQSIEKSDLIPLITTLFTSNKSAKRFILRWLAKLEKMQLKGPAGNPTSK